MQIFWAPVETNNMLHNGEALWRRGQEEASLQIARWWDRGRLWLERKRSPLREITSAQPKLQHKQLKISQICKENQRITPAPLHNANRQKDRLAEDACLWLLFGRNTSNSLTNRFLMVCMRGISFFFHHYSVDIMWGNKLKDDWSGKWLLVYCNSV